MSAILNMVAKSPAPGSVNSNKELRGIKRKAKGDPYDEIDDDDPAQKTRRTRLRISSEAPVPSIKTRPSSIGKPNNRRTRSLGIRKDVTVDGPRAHTSSNITRLSDTQHSRLEPYPEQEYTKSSLVPIADMGLPESPTGNDTITTSRGPAQYETESVDKVYKTGGEKGKGKAIQPNHEVKERADMDEREEHEVDSLLKHRMALSGSGKVELLVRWVGEEEDEATWELEEEVQRGASETLYTYWKTQGGRINALFIKPKNAPPESYHAFKILGHNKKKRGGFEFEVQWVGHPPTRGETSVEAEPKLRKIAPEALGQYWESVGGRDNFLAKRGRNRKARIDQ
ncbi:uncharacterized protein GGS22DRAFT_182630 [Annulohypoxylon maeteangense]|uniref:uncharacterized protein n=1 Tax=Annulohypoxylon maeteangense TaxID=1927788 RepID=UPI002008C53B|nr:uncharacterized protein GGS22DRAFT_182630 [Annulohypoxylon maeteangense]KAI0879991.1 hypothetical protein GGS22DRAFT_182630 [Annulohypoxylon maeteangense]